MIRLPGVLGAPNEAFELNRGEAVLARLAQQPRRACDSACPTRQSAPVNGSGEGNG